MKFRSALSFRSAAPVVTALCLLALAGCARTTGSARPAANPEVRPTDAPNQGVPTASQVISPRQDTWNFDASPDPAPSARPLYRMNEITFDFNSTAFGKEGNGVCRDAAEQLRRTNGKVLLLGYTHYSEPGGNSLGIRRAEKVRDCLRQHGLDPNRFELSTFGSRYSVADRTAPMKMEQERRVEIWVISE